MVLFLLVLVSMSTENNISKYYICSQLSDLVKTWLDVTFCLDWLSALDQNEHRIHLAWRTSYSNDYEKVLDKLN